jgi:hypothetical protein
VEQPGQAPLDEPRAPLADGVVGDAQLGGHAGAGLTVGAKEHDAGALGQTITGLGAFEPADQFGWVRLGEREGSLVGDGRGIA